MPAKSLKEHYSAPKKPPPRRPSVVERSNLDDIDIPESISMVSSLKKTDSDWMSDADLSKRAETPKVTITNVEHSFQV